MTAVSPPLKAASARPLPPGTRIDYCGEEAVVVCDDGGRSIDVIVCGEGRMTWAWKFDGTECVVIPSPDEPPLCFSLKAHLFDAFERGTKTEEYRPYNRRWDERTCRIGRRVVVGCGKRRRAGTISSFDQSRGQTKTQTWQETYGGNGPAVAACIGIVLDPLVS
jgi:hypothetical protein